MPTSVLCVEDDLSLQSLVMETLLKQGYDVHAVSSAEDALAHASLSRFDILLTDVRLPLMSGVDLIPRIRNMHPDTAVVVMSGHASVQEAVTAMKRGALDFVTKPFTARSLLNVLRMVTTRRHTLTVPSAESPHPIEGESAQTRLLRDQIDRVAVFNLSILIIGETGTGKELVARQLHARSPRAKGPFVAVNCAAIPEQLLEDELFGHVRGAFTGAQEAREGRFQQAHGGTLFLDEIGDMGLSLQAKLLRVLQERQFEKLGSGQTTSVDVRILAATSANLDRRIHDGSFRPDLFYRLNVIRLDIPPLRDRREDIERLARVMLDQFGLDAHLPNKNLSPDALAALLAYDWPGNVRQLRNAMERASVMTGTEPLIRRTDLPPEILAGLSGVNSWTPSTVQSSPSRPDIPADDVLRDIERNLLLDALARTGGNKLQAARLLGIKRTTFTARLRRVQSGDDGGN